MDPFSIPLDMRIAIDNCYQITMSEPNKRPRLDEASPNGGPPTMYKQPRMDDPPTMSRRELKKKGYKENAAREAAGREAARYSILTASFVAVKGKCHG
jgi:hypothetical protein